MDYNLEVGTKFRKKDAPDFVLEVIELFTPDGEQPHARARVSMAQFWLSTLRARSSSARVCATRAWLTSIEALALSNAALRASYSCLEISSSL